jgi:hypothetical protein
MSVLCWRLLNADKCWCHWSAVLFCVRAEWLFAGKALNLCSIDIFASLWDEGAVYHVCMPLLWHCVRQFSAWEIAKHSLHLGSIVVVVWTSNGTLSFAGIMLNTRYGYINLITDELHARGFYLICWLGMLQATYVICWILVKRFYLPRGVRFGRLKVPKLIGHYRYAELSFIYWYVFLYIFNYYVTHRY